jgi:hypothetical protein
MSRLIVMAVARASTSTPSLVTLLEQGRMMVPGLDMSQMLRSRISELLVLAIEIARGCNTPGMVDRSSLASSVVRICTGWARGI